MGYTKVREYVGGMEDWLAHGNPVVRRARASGADPVRRSPSRRAIDSLLDVLAGRSLGSVLRLWLALVSSTALVYWGLALAGMPCLVENGTPVGGGLRGLLTALYFSLVTATSVGYGDVAPHHAARVLAVFEAAGGLLLFGCVVSKLVSRRQEQLTEEIHRIAFEDRLGRVRANLHAVLSELQALETLCQSGGLERRRLLARVESAATVFAGELWTVHDLLYRPQQVPEEQVLRGMLAILAAGLREFADLVERVPDAPAQSPSLFATLASVRRLSGEICGECVPKEYAPELRTWMDEIQVLSGRLSGS